jgi:hypothetical protein
VSAAPLLARLGTLASGASATVTIVVAPQFALINSRFAGHANESDPNAANDAAEFSAHLYPALPSRSPQVLSLRPIRVKRKGLTAIVINFDQPMNPGALQKVGIYHLVTVGSGKRFRPKVVGLATAKYDVASRSVRLSLKKPVTAGTLRLTINHSGVIAASGIGLSGGDYVAIVPK